MKQSYSSTIEENLKQYNSSLDGLNSEQAKSVYEKNGPNSLGEAKRKAGLLNFSRSLKTL